MSDACYVNKKNKNGMSPLMAAIELENQIRKNLAMFKFVQ